MKRFITIFFYQENGKDDTEQFAIVPKHSRIELAVVRSTDCEDDKCCSSIPPNIRSTRRARYHRINMIRVRIKFGTR
jgi:hypothetical protein